MSLLTAAQALCDRTSLQRVGSVMTNTSTHARQLKAFLEMTGMKIRDSQAWPELSRTWSITIQSGVQAYALPTDFNTWIFNTIWNSTKKWPLHGPLTPEEWQQRKNGVIQAGTYQRFRVQGVTGTQLYIDPVPTATGDILVFEYYSNNWIRPVTWSSGVTFQAGSYCSYNGNNYVAQNTATSGGTAPVHTAGTVADGVGGVNWAIYIGNYEVFTADTDEFVIHQENIVENSRWTYRRDKGLTFQHLENEAKGQLDIAASDRQGASAIYVGENYESIMISGANVPDTGFGT